MTTDEFSQLAARLMRCPAAPYHESIVRAEVRLICREHGLASATDRWGNLLVRLNTAPRLRPIALAAHLDHPGFEIIRRRGAGRWSARFLGGVPEAYFHADLPLRLLPGARPARLGKWLKGDRCFEILGRTGRVRPEFAVWELPDFAVRGGRIHGRACDDLIGVAASLATLIELRRSGARVNVIGVISRAEEVGFHGALTVAASRRLPKNTLVISLETSRELPPAKMGAGVIVRVGDRSSSFDSAGTRFLAEVAAGLQKRHGRFRFQRALMSGGTCEATAFQEFGFQTAAICVALGNYHNCARQDKIAAEYVSLADACGMVALLVEAARQMPAYTTLTGQLPQRLRALLVAARRRLRPKQRPPG